jgi:hypothetical protein
MYLLITAFLSLGSGAGILFQDAGKSVEAYGAHAAWLQEFARAVHNAAQDGPARPSRAETVRRHILDIQYHTDAMLAAGRTTDRASADVEKNKVFTLLQHGLDHGYFTHADTESLIQVLQKYLPGPDS